MLKIVGNVPKTQIHTIVCDAIIVLVLSQLTVNVLCYNHVFKRLIILFKDIWDFVSERVTTYIAFDKTFIT